MKKQGHLWRVVYSTEFYIDSTTTQPAKIRENLEAYVITQTDSIQSVKEGIQRKLNNQERLLKLNATWLGVCEWEF